MLTTWTLQYKFDYDLVETDRPCWRWPPSNSHPILKIARYVKLNDSKLTALISNIDKARSVMDHVTKSHKYLTPQPSPKSQSISR